MEQKTVLLKYNDGSYGFDFTNGGGGTFWISDVLHEDAKCNGLKVGQRLLAINGLPLLGFDYAGVFDMLTTSGNSVSLTVSAESKDNSLVTSTIVATASVALPQFQPSAGGGVIMDPLEQKRSDDIILMETLSDSLQLITSALANGNALNKRKSISRSISQLNSGTELNTSLSDEYTSRRNERSVSSPKEASQSNNATSSANTATANTSPGVRLMVKKAYKSNNTAGRGSYSANNQGPRYTIKGRKGSSSPQDNYGSVNRLLGATSVHSLPGTINATALSPQFTLDLDSSNDTASVGGSNSGANCTPDNFRSPHSGPLRAVHPNIDNNVADYISQTLRLKSGEAPHAVMDPDISFTPTHFNLERSPLEEKASPVRWISPTPQDFNIESTLCGVGPLGSDTARILTEPPRPVKLLFSAARNDTAATAVVSSSGRSPVDSSRTTCPSCQEPDKMCAACSPYRQDSYRFAIKCKPGSAASSCVNGETQLLRNRSQSSDALISDTPEAQPQSQDVARPKFKRLLVESTPAAKKAAPNEFLRPELFRARVVRDNGHVVKEKHWHSCLVSVESLKGGGGGGGVSSSEDVSLFVILTLVSNSGATGGGGSISRKVGTSAAASSGSCTTTFNEENCNPLRDPNVLVVLQLRGLYVSVKRTRASNYATLNLSSANGECEVRLQHSDANLLERWALNLDLRGNKHPTIGRSLDLADGSSASRRSATLTSNNKLRERQIREHGQGHGRSPIPSPRLKSKAKSASDSTESSGSTSSPPANIASIKYGLGPNSGSLGSSGSTAASQMHIWKQATLNLFRSGNSKTSINNFHPGSQSPVEERAPHCSYGVPLHHCPKNGALIKSTVFTGASPSAVNVENSESRLNVPLIVEVCTRLVEETGLEALGIYRSSGNEVAIKMLEAEFSKSLETMSRNHEKWNDPFVVGAILKRFLMQLSDPLIPSALYDLFLQAYYKPQWDQRMMSLQKILSAMASPEESIEKLFRCHPEYRCHHDTLRYIVHHLRLVAFHSSRNKMSVSNLAVVMAPSIFAVRDPVRMMADTRATIGLVELLVRYQDWLFCAEWDREMPSEMKQEHAPTVSAADEEERDMAGGRTQIDVRPLLNTLIEAALTRLTETKEQPFSRPSIVEQSEPDDNELDSFKEVDIDAALRSKELQQKEAAAAAGVAHKSDQQTKTRSSASLLSVSQEHLSDLVQQQEAAERTRASCEARRIRYHDKSVACLELLQAAEHDLLAEQAAPDSSPIVISRTRGSAKFNTTADADGSGCARGSNDWRRYGQASFSRSMDTLAATNFERPSAFFIDDDDDKDTSTRSVCRGDSISNSHIAHIIHDEQTTGNVPVSELRAQWEARGTCHPTWQMPLQRPHSVPQDAIRSSAKERSSSSNDAQSPIPRRHTLARLNGVAAQLQLYTSSICGTEDSDDELSDS